MILLEGFSLLLLSNILLFVLHFTVELVESTVYIVFDTVLSAF